MASNIKGPALFLAQFAGDKKPFNSFDAICKWAGSLGYKGVQIPTWDGRLFDLKKPRLQKPIAMKSKALRKNTASKSPNFQPIFKASLWL